MKTHNRNLIIGGTVVMLLIGLYLWFAVKKANAAKTTAATQPGTSTGSGTTVNQSTAATNSVTSQATSTNVVSATVSSWLDWLMGTGSSPMPSQTQYTTTDNASVFPLKSGSSGPEVTNLQIWLNNHVILPFALLNVDGKFGSKTLSALQRTLGVSTVTEDWYKVNILNS